MKRVTSVIAAMMMVALVVQVSSAGSDGENVVEFDTMFGVDGPFVGTMNPVREVPGGGLPWQIERGRGELSADGEGGEGRGPGAAGRGARAGGSTGDEPDAGVPSDRQLPHDRQRSGRDQQRPTSSRSS